ncbi:MAG: hypothetical protein ACPGVB_11170 [Chitinophagales bacterium]
MSNISKDKSFKNWTIEGLILQFGIQQIFQCNILKKWLSEKHSLSDFEVQTLEILQKKAALKIHFWNKAELRAKLIDHVTELVDYEAEDFLIAAFSKRNIETTYLNTKLKGKVDWVVATGRSQPTQPFFFIHEYKKEKGTSDDPLAQLLAAMIAAKSLHQTPPKPNLFNPNPVHFYKDMTIYGCYIIGRNWFFVTLEENSYCVSEAYDSTKMKRLKEIVNSLKTQKMWILEQLEKYGTRIG